jgi:hypothetical protein
MSNVTLSSFEAPPISLGEAITIVLAIIGIIVTILALPFLLIESASLASS